MKYLTFSIIITLLTSCTVFSQPFIEWERRIDFTRKDQLVDFVTMNDGSFIGVGSSIVEGARIPFDHNYYKFDCNGKIIWRKQLVNYGTSNNYGGTSTKIVNIKENTFAIYGGGYSKKDTSSFKQLAFITLIDSSGNVLKSKEFIDSPAITIVKIISDNNGGLVMVLNTRSNTGVFQDNKGFDDIWLIKLDLQLNILQKKNIGGEGIDQANFITKSKDGGYILTGATFSRTGDFKAPYANMNIFNTRSDAFVMKLDEALNIEWSTAFGGNQGEIANSVLEMPDKSLVVGGTTGSYDGVFAGRNTSFSTDTYVARLGPSGSFSSAKFIGNDQYKGTTVVLFAQLLPIDSSNYLLMCYGQTREGIFNTPNDMTWLLKMNTKLEIVWKKGFGVIPKIGIDLGNKGYQIKKTLDKGYLIVGEAGDSVTARKNSWLLKLSPLEVDKQIPCEGLSLYPNPTVGNIKIQSSNYLQSGTEIKVIDVIGRNIYHGITEKICKDSDIILPNDLASGLYYLTIDNTKCVLPFVRVN
jgi:hypothetical protein